LLLLLAAGWAPAQAVQSSYRRNQSKSADYADYTDLGIRENPRESADHCGPGPPGRAICG